MTWPKRAPRQPRQPQQPYFVLGQNGERIPVTDATDDCLLAAARYRTTHLKKTWDRIDRAIHDELRRRGINGPGYFASRCSVEGCGKKALYRANLLGFCSDHRDVASAMLRKRQAVGFEPKSRMFAEIYRNADAKSLAVKRFSAASKREQTTIGLKRGR